jgi:hypothetical protein
MYITLAKTKNIFTLCVGCCPLFGMIRKAIMAMDQTLKGRSHHDLVDIFSKKNFREISKPINILNIKYTTDIKTPMTNLQAKRNPLIALKKNVQEGTVTVKMW